MNVMIRDAVETDIPGVQTLAEIVFRQEYAKNHDEAYITRFLNRVYSDVSLKRAITGEGSTLLVAHAGDTMVGLCNFGSPLLEDCKDRKEIFRLFVHPHYARQGIGGQLISQAVNHLSHLGGVYECTVYLHQTDAIRQAFYQKYRFRHIPSRDQDENLCLVRSI